jgi:adenine specific DNA methylase Mod
MKMSIFATLAKAKLDIESIKGSNLVAVKSTVKIYAYTLHEVQIELPNRTITF